MAILRSIDGRLYQVPDEEAAKFLIPADKVADTLRQAGIQAPTGAGQQAPQQMAGQTQAYCSPWGGGWWGGGPTVYYNYNNYNNYYNYWRGW